MRIFSLVVSGLRGRKRDTAVLGCILLLAFLFLTLSSILLASFSATAQQQRQALHGNWQMLYYDAGPEAAERCAAIADCGEMRLVGSTKDGRLVGSIDASVLELGSLQLEEGRLPRGEDEILLVRGRMAKEPALGESLELVYIYDYMRGGSMQRSAVMMDAVLSSLRELSQDPKGEELSFDTLYEQYLREARAGYDAERHCVVFDGEGEGYGRVARVMLPPDMELEQALAEREDQLLYAWAMFHFMQEGYVLNHPFLTSNVTAYPGGLFSYGGFLINVKKLILQTTYIGWGFSEEYRGVCAEQPQISEAVLYKSYTVVGYVSPYADHWDARGCAMPDAFVSPEAADAHVSALRRAEEDYYEGAPRFEPTSILLLRDGDGIEALEEKVLPIFSQVQQPYYQIDGFSRDARDRQEGFLTGLDPHTGELKTLQLVCYGTSYYLQDDLGDWHELSGNPASSAHWAELQELLLPLQPEELSAADLEEGSRYALRLNQYSFPPSSSAEGSVQLLCSGILIGVAAVSSFQVFWVQLRRRRMRLTTLMAVGATDGQVFRMLLLEILLLLAIACLLGTGLGFALAGVMTRILGTGFAVRWPYLFLGLGCCFAAVLLSALIPMLLVLRSPLTGREPVSRRILSLRPPRRTRRQSYRRIQLRQMIANRGRTALQFALAWLLVLIGLLTVFLCHSAYAGYRKTVTETGMPDYELLAPYAMSSRYLESSLQLAQPLAEASEIRVSREAPNVWLHCSAFLDESPILRTLQELPQAENMFRSLPEGETGFAVRAVGLQPESPQMERLLASLPEGAVDPAELEAGDACILLVPRYLPEGDLVRVRDVNEEALENLREDEKAGVLLDLHYDRLYAATGLEDTAIRPGDTITVTAFSQSMAGERLSEKSVTRQIRVAAVLSTLEEPLWPLSDNCASHVLISGPALVYQLYPSANTRMTGAQARSHRFMAKIFYPDCYGLTRFTIWNRADADAIAQDTAASDFSEELGLDFSNSRMLKEREETNAQRRWMLFLLLGIEMALVVATLVYSTAGMSVEQDRYRYGTLQALGVSDLQMFIGQLRQALALALAACLAANLILALLHLLVAAVSGRFLQTLLENTDRYPWGAHGAVCLAFLALYPLLQSLPILRVSRQEPIRNIRS